MLGRSSLAVLALVVGGVRQNAAASPITYDFTGQFQAPLNGSTQFSGSFTINGDPPGDLHVPQNGVDVSMTVNMGGHTYTFTNSPQNPNQVFFVYGASSIYLTPPLPGATIYGATPNGAREVTFGLTSDFNPSANNLNNLRDLSFPLGSSSTYTTALADDGTVFQYHGSITSIEPVTTPEPSTLAVFGVLGFGVLAARRRRPAAGVQR